jgi:hypothetical protein
MVSKFSNIFSENDILYINQLSEVLEAKSKVETNPYNSKESFNITLTDSLRSSLNIHLGLNLSNVSTIPMRWIKGNTSPHIDMGSTRFENTYLVYLNDSPGEFIIDTEHYPITANTGYIFNEGLKHETQNTGTNLRLLLGPMNELANPVGTPVNIIYYDNYADAYLQNNNHIATQYTTFVLGDTINFFDGNIGSYTTWRIAYIGGNPPPSGVYSNGFDLNTLGFNTHPFYVYPSAPCFLEGTQILCNIGGIGTIDGTDIYIPIENMKPGTFVKTSKDGYKKVELIGKGTIQNPATDERIENRLYKCSTSEYPELKNDLYITGCHSILVDSLTDKQREETIKCLGKIYITDNKYRLMAYIDEKAQPWNSQGDFTIWHFALENNDYFMNYGVYANGLLVETCSKRYMNELSNMTLL